jgi:hypothetical protein
MNMNHLRSRTKNARAHAAVAALLLASGCGMYGDLFLPEPAPQAPPEVEERAPIAADGSDPAAAAEGAAETEEERAKPRGTPPDGARDDAAGRS